MTRTILALPLSLLIGQALFLALPAPAPARQDDRTPPTQVVGRWSVEGVDAARAPFSAVMSFAAGRDGRMTYTRRVLSVGGAAVTLIEERGAARVRGGFLYTLEDARGGLDLVDHLSGLEGAQVAPRRGVYRVGAAGQNVLEGRFEGSALRSGTETLRRAGADNDVRLLIDGPEAFPTIYTALRGAKRQICLQTFSWFDDRAGREIADILIAKRREGVEVRCLIEAFPQKGGVGWKTGKYLRENGVEVIVHHTLTEGLKNSISSFGKKLWSAFTGLFKKKKPEPPREKRGILNHDHRKLIVVDGTVAFTGGMNIGDKYLEGTTWHDVHCRVEGSAVVPMEAMFWERWGAAGGKGRALPVTGSRTGTGALPVEVLENLPGIRLDVTDRYLREIGAARSEILVENAYMLYDPVVNGLKRKAQTGVRVAVILPSNDLNDEAFARDAFLWIQNDVVRSGVEVYKYRTRMSHGKVALFDRQLSTIGTTNLDALACVNNAEINLWIPDRGFARTVQDRVFQTDIPNSDRVKEEKLSWWRKIVAGTMNSIRAFL
jgi:cardiolipin synthase